MWGCRKVYCAGSDCKFKILMRPTEQSMPQMMVLFHHGDNNAPPKLDSLLSWSVRAYTEVGNRNDSGAADPYMVTRTLAKAAEKNGATVALDLPPVTIMQTTSSASNESSNGRTVIAAGLWTSKEPPGRTSSNTERREGKVSFSQDLFLGVLFLRPPYPQKVDSTMSS